MLKGNRHRAERPRISHSGGFVPASSILLLETDPVAGAGIETILGGSGYAVTHVTSADETIGQAGDHQLVILDVLSGIRSGIDVCAEIRATPSLSAVPVMCISTTDDVEERIRYLEAGADDVMARPFDARELEARVEALLLRFQRSRDLSPTISTDGVVMTKARRTVAVFSPKGGVGTTTIATNVAVAAASHRPTQVVLVDLALQFGGVATHLNLRPRQTLADVVRDDAAMREPELLRSYATPHSSGLHVLAAPAQPEAAETITQAQVDRILGTLLDAYEQVVVDAGSTLDERVLAVFERADTVVLPVYPEIAALNAMHTLLEYLTEIGALGSKAMLVLNNAFAREILKQRDVESALGGKVTLELPYDPFIYLKAVNEGIPIVIGASRSVAAERFARLASTAFGRDGAAPARVQEEHRSGGLFRLRR
jgi:pilus assembly protein CpaE